MIIATNGDIRIHGDMSEVMTDLTLIIRKIKEALEEDLGEEKAREYIAKAGKLAFSSEEDIRAEAAQKIAKVTGLEVDDVATILKRVETMDCSIEEFMKKLAPNADEDNEEE